MNKTLFIAALFACAAPITARAVSVTGNATAVILSAITATQTQQMNFGSIVPGAAAGTVVLTPAGAVSSGTLELHGTPTAGQFTITAQPSTALTITFTNGTVTSGSNTMAVDTFTSTTTPASSTTNASGSLTLNVGATLHVAATQAPGTYSGTYGVTVNY